MTQVTVTFTLSIPGRLARFMALSKQERRAVYWGWWQTTKKEAHHYWVLPPFSDARTGYCSRRHHMQGLGIGHVLLSRELTCGSWLSDPYICVCCSPGPNYYLQRSRLRCA